MGLVTVELDEETARELQKRAKNRGLSVSDYLATLLPRLPVQTRPNWEEIEREFISLSADGPSLPPEFSRADIYLE